MQEHDCVLLMHRSRDTHNQYITLATALPFAFSSEEGEEDDTWQELLFVHFRMGGGGVDC